MRADWIAAGELAHVLAALTPPNRVAMEISLATGMRIGDVLAIKREQAERGRWTYREAKTGKPRRVRLPLDLQKRAIALTGNLYVFEGRSDGTRHRTRQAVYKDLRRAAKLFRLKDHVSPHSARKAYAVSAYEKTGDIEVVQKDLNHSSQAVTMLYAMADQLTKNKKSHK